MLYLRLTWRLCDAFFGFLCLLFYVAHCVTECENELLIVIYALPIACLPCFPYFVFRADGVIRQSCLCRLL
jgi:hypothetical protein